jgi:4,5-DOPA dioxygenase extradiol
MPAIFVGHGNPMNAIEQNAYTAAWQRLAASLPRPRAILSVSAHWYVAGGRVTADDWPATIHDLGGFPRALFEVGYPARGSPELARRVADMLAPAPIELDTGWGLDHGTWSLLVHLYPGADVPVVQLSLDETAPAEEHLAIAARLRPLRDEGVLVLASGNVVHNLHTYAWGRGSPAPYPWATRFEAKVRALVEAGDAAAVARWEAMGEDAALCAPTPEHFLPLLYALALREPGEPVAFPVEGFDGGSVSMLGVTIG